LNFSIDHSLSLEDMFSTTNAVWKLCHLFVTV
jgi:hypothetical protein